MSSHSNDDNDINNLQVGLSPEGDNSNNNAGNGGGSGNTPNDDSERIFVTKIPREASEEELRDYFTQFGTIVDFHMPKVPGRQGHKGIAFISYEDCDIATNVRKMGGHMLCNQELVVDHATPRNPAISHDRKMQARQQFFNNGNNMGGNRMYNQQGMNRMGGNFNNNRNDNNNFRGGQFVVPGGGNGGGFNNNHNNNMGGGKGGNGMFNERGNNGNGSGNIDRGLLEQLDQLDRQARVEAIDRLLGMRDGGNNNRNDNNFGNGGGNNNNMNRGNNMNPNMNNNHPNNMGKGGNHQQGGFNNNNGGNNNRGFDNGFGNNNRNGGGGMGMGSNSNGGGSNSGMDSERNRVFVTKIGPTISKDNLIEYFNQFGPLADCYVPQATNPSQPHKGIAFISFKDPRIAEEVLQRPSYEIKPGQYIVVDKANARMDGPGGVPQPLVDGGPRGSPRGGPGPMRAIGNARSHPY